MKRTSRFLRHGAVFAALALLGACSGSHVLPAAGNLSSDPGNSLYVNASVGSDRNDGSFKHPLRTISQCASRARKGQTCFIRGGIYHENTIRPNSGVKIQSLDASPVTMLATHRVKHWKLYSGHIYVASVTLNSTLPANQVFIGPGTKLLNEAQFPTPSSNPLQPTWAVEASGSTSKHIVDPKLPAVNLTGAIVNVWSGTDPWTHIQGPVASSGGGSLTFTPNGGYCHGSTCDVGSMPGGFYYVTGALGLLTAPGEWWYDSAKRLLYLWAPRGKNPNKLDVEAKQEQVLIDLSGRSGVTVQGVTLIGGGIMMDSNSTNNTITGITALYVSQVLWADNNYRTFYSWKEGSGLVLDGSGNVIENSTIAYSATNGVLLRGQNNTVTNSLIHDVDWIGDYSAGVLPIAGNNQITYNTIYNTGRAAVEDDYSAKMPTSNLEIGNNNFFNAMYLSVDGGTIYATAQYGQLAKGTKIYDNWLHPEIKPAGRIPHSNTCNCPWAGMYVDSGIGGLTIDHNVIWDAYPDLTAFPSKDVHVSYNTLLDSNPKVMWLGCYGSCDDKYPHTMVNDNLLYSTIWNRGERKVPQKDNSSTAPGAGTVPPPGCTISGCNVGSSPPKLVTNATAI